MIEGLKPNAAPIYFVHNEFEKSSLNSVTLLIKTLLGGGRSIFENAYM